MWPIPSSSTSDSVFSLDLDDWNHELSKQEGVLFKVRFASLHDAFWTRDPEPA